MINTIRNSKLSKVIASYMAIQLIFTTVQPFNLFALTGGPSQPEFNSFSPIGTSDMVNLSSGDFNYNIPIMDVGGYPLNLTYDSGITMDQEASWVGLGWNLNIGQINRQVRGIPDDFKGDGAYGDKIKYEQSQKKNKTVGMTFFVNGQFFGAETGNASGETPTVPEVPTNGETQGNSSGNSNSPTLNAALTIEHNNYEGTSITPSMGFAFNVAGTASVGMNLSSSATEGVSASPTIGLTKSWDVNNDKFVGSYNANLGAGLTYNSRQGLTSFNINTSLDAPRIVEGLRTNGRVSYNNLTFTPTKRSSYHNSSFTFDASVGTDFWGIDAEIGLTAFGNQQKIKEKVTHERAYGYENSKYASSNDILDFNRENDNAISKNSLVLPTVNYTYDLYSIQGQGTGGQFRPYKSQVGYVFDKYIEDTGASGQLGVEVEGATGFHVGVDLKYTDIRNHTGVWNTPAKSMFENDNNNNPDYEETYFKSTGDLNVDNNVDLFKNKLGGENPIALNIVSDGERSYGKYATNVFRKRTDNIIPNNSSEPNNFEYGTININESIKRIPDIHNRIREKRNQAIQKVTELEALYDPFVNHAGVLQPHHTNGYKITNPDGSRYIYGEAAVNLTKEEVTFSVNGTASDPENGLTNFTSLEDSPGNKSGIDHYYNKVTTPAYAHSYLLTSVLSSDYEDVTGDGISDDDLGAYTKIIYNDFSNDFADSETENEIVSSVASNFKWRTPYDNRKATYSAGFNTNTGDQKASYVQGTKQLKYATRIETKTHVAVLDFSRRKDGRSAVGTNGFQSIFNSQLRLMAIKLYSKPEYNKLIAGDNSITPIKTAHFEYDYSLMQNTPSTYSIASTGGKLTLKKVYFTYRGSKMGQFTPYVFHYDNLNPDYQMRSNDIWGNYKPLYEGNNPNTDSGCEAHNDLMASEFPFVDQNNKEQQDLYASAWTLSSIDLPSGGKIELEFESDDYQYVQDKKAMQMFKVVGVLDADNTDNYNDLMTSGGHSVLYNGNRDAKYIVVQLPEDEPIYSEMEEGDFIDRYLGEHYNKPIYFNFLTNMEKSKNCSYDYVSGYFEIDKSVVVKFLEGTNGETLAAIPMKTLQMEGGNNTINPITKAGWYFGRKNLNRYVYGVGDNTPENASLKDIVNALGGAFGGYLDIFRAPNAPLRYEELIARKFIPEKSWIRLQHPKKGKLGGGLRVKRVLMHDNWHEMNNESENSAYANFYGQEYSYELDNDEGSSGVATWEPNVSKENPFVEPFYNIPEKLIAPKEVNYVEKPFGQSFFPAPTVTYSRVVVSNLKREDSDGVVLKKHATGNVVNEFYTFKDFPTIANYTELDDPLNYKSNLGNLGNSLLSSITGIVRSKTELALSQGFSIITNDMNGKSKSQKVFNENGSLVSGVDYIYNVDSNGNLDNELPVVLKDGSIEKQLIGTQYDVITDFRESFNHTSTHGLSTNVAGFVIGIFPIIIPLGLYSGQDVKSTLHTTTVTKVIHKSGILKEKIAYDLGAKVSTRNLAWDAGSGQVLLTETVNEYDDDYYNFSYPAYWMYPNMGQAVENLGIEFILEPTPTNGTVQGQSGDEEGNSAWYKLSSQDYSQSYALSHYLNEGDEVVMYNHNPGSNGGTSYQGHFWINEILNNQIVFTDINGDIFNPCGDDELRKRIKVIRSAKRNLQSASMASVTSMKNPFILDEDAEFGAILDPNTNPETINFTNLTNTSFRYNGPNGGFDNPKIINSSAVEYKDFWRPQGEHVNGTYPESNQLNNSNLVPYPFEHTNPFVNNIKGDWRAVKSYAYLTGRSNNASPRNDGFYTSFKPFYIYNDQDSKWEKNTNSIENGDDTWTYASEVSQYSPYGAELENKDALNRYSAAQYGYNYTLPTAVASNSAYKEMGFDGFEDYSYNSANNPEQHFSFKSALNSSVTRTDETAHTGRYSIKVPSGQTASLQARDQEFCEVEVDTLDCAPPPPPPTFSINGRSYAHYYQDYCPPQYSNTTQGYQTVFQLGPLPPHTNVSYPPYSLYSILQYLQSGVDLKELVIVDFEAFNPYVKLLDGNNNEITQFPHIINVENISQTQLIPNLKINQLGIPKTFLCSLTPNINYDNYKIHFQLKDTNEVLSNVTTYNYIISNYLPDLEGSTSGRGTSSVHSESSFQDSYGNTIIIEYGDDYRINKIIEN
ncbi:MAG: hypothetical protein ACX93I_10075 [Winogradskyella sp.]